jgi:poly(A) polymerase Pap1
MAESQKHWGVTGSISFARPTEEEVSANAALIEELKAQGSFESAEESQRRCPFVWPTKSVQSKGACRASATYRRIRTQSKS